MTTLLATIATHHWGYGPGLWILFPLLFWGTLIFFLVTRGRRFGPSWRSGEAVLAERYARGEIDADEYRNRLATLREQGR
jgi:putative membrane protein